MNNGFITIHRKITEWEWYKDLPTYKTFMHCLHKANWKDGKFQGRVIKRGSFVTSYNNFSHETGLTVRQVRTAINKLKLTSELTSETTNKFTIITVTNYCLYQDERQATGQTNDKQMTNKGQTNDNNRTSIKKETKQQERDSHIFSFVSAFVDDTISAHDKTAPKKTSSLLDSSYDAVDKLIRIDGFTLSEIQSVVLWAMQDEFWKDKVLSLATLRKKNGSGIMKFQSIKVQYDKKDGVKKDKGWYK